MLIYEDGNPLCRIVDGSPSAGARSGMPLATALERCPGATAIAANMKLYQRQWAAVIGRLKSIAVGVEETNLVVHQFWIDGYKDFNFMRASAVVKRQSTFMAS